jgi:hypothetical protein
MKDEGRGRKNMDEINHPETLAELTALAWRYERALVSNDIPTLDALFWAAPQVVRFGATENLYGSDELRAFRAGRPAANLAREVSNLRVVTFGRDTGAVTLEFIRVTDGVPRHGRQSQMWRRFADGTWKVVSAHVSLLPR